MLPNFTCVIAKEDRGGKEGREDPDCSVESLF